MLNCVEFVVPRNEEDVNPNNRNSGKRFKGKGSLISFHFFLF